MDPLEQKRLDKLNEDQSNIRKKRKFENQFKDPKDPTRLRQGLKVEEVFGAAEFVPTKWSDLEFEDKKWIQEENRDQEVYGVGSRPWESLVFASPDKKTFYFLKMSGRNFAWSRFSTAEGNRMIEPFNHDSNLSEVIGTVATHEIGEKLEEAQELESAPKQEETKAVEDTRKKAKRNLKPNNPRSWEVKK